MRGSSSRSWPWPAPDQGCVRWCHPCRWSVRRRHVPPGPARWIWADCCPWPAWSAACRGCPCGGCDFSVSGCAASPPSILSDKPHPPTRLGRCCSVSADDPPLGARLPESGISVSAQKRSPYGAFRSNSGWLVLQVVHSGSTIAALVSLAVHHSVVHAGVAVGPPPYGSRTRAEAGGGHPDLLAPFTACPVAGFVEFFVRDGLISLMLGRNYA